MLTKSWRRFRSPAAWTFAIVLGAPMLAEAQQSGLFPLAPIRRQRVPCPMEDPVYGLYRQEYFGYHPTCWRRFPAGWGCPSPEAPNAAAAFDPNQPGGRKRDPAPPIAPIDDFGDEEPDAGMEGPAIPGVPGGAGGGALPQVPAGERSPFDLDTPKPSNEPPPARPARRPAESPLELPPPVDPQGKPADTPPPAELPPAGALVPGVPAGAETAPLLALPDPGPSAPGTGMPAPGLMAQPQPAMVPGPSAYAPAPAPTQAPRRTSMLGGLFGGLRRR